MKFYFVQTDQLKNERWDTNYWRSDLLVIIEQISRFKVEVVALEEIAEISNGKSGSRIFTEDGEVQYLVIANLLKTGVNLKKRPRFVEEDGLNDPARSKVSTGDILMPISGSGSIAKSTLVQNLFRKANISQDIARIRVREDVVFSTFLYLQSKWGVSQILRSESGTGVTHLSLEDLKQFRIPLLSTEVEEWSRDQLTRLNEYHEDYVKHPNSEKKRRLEIERLRVIEQFEKKCTLLMRK